MGHAETLWWDSDDGGWVSSPGDCNAAAVMLQPAARRRGRDMHLEGSVSRSRLANLEEHQDVWERWQPGSWNRVRLGADEVVTDEPAPGRDAVLAFSGGVDASYTLVANLHGLLGHRSLRPTTAVLIIGMDIDLDEVEAAAVAARNARTIAESFGLRFRVVRTNWRRDWCPSYPMTFLHGVTGTLRLLVSSGESILVSGGGTYEDLPTPHGQHAITDHLLGEDRHPVVTTGFGVDRITKCRVVAEHEVIRTHVRVCWQDGSGGSNCGQCEKCVRTKLNFAAAGVGEVPALGPVTVEQVARIELRTETAANLLAEVLRYEQELGATLTRAVRERLGR